MRKVLSILPLSLALLGCPTTDQIDHMEHQPKGKPYRESAFYADGQLMRRPPADTVAQEHDEGNLSGSMPDGGLTTTATTIPEAVNPELLALGQAKFNQVCAICHGALGDGNSIVARKMSLRPPPNITTQVYRERTDASIFATITNGYGYMNPYRDQLSSRERWAVVAYLRALQLSQHVPREQLSADEVHRIETASAAKPGEHEGEGHHE